MYPLLNPGFNRCTGGSYFYINWKTIKYCTAKDDERSECVPGQVINWWCWWMLDENIIISTCRKVLCYCQFLFTIVFHFYLQWGYHFVHLTCLVINLCESVINTSVLNFFIQLPKEDITAKMMSEENCQFLVTINEFT